LAWVDRQEEQADYFVPLLVAERVGALALFSQLQGAHVIQAGD
jgi:hypothetical protein